MREIPLFLTFFSSLSLSIVLFSLIIWAYLYTSIFSRFYRREKGRSRSKIFFRLGGFFAILFFLVALLGNSYLVLSIDIMWLFWGSLAFLILGFWDDLKSISWKWQLYWQSVIIFVIIFFAKIRIESIPSLFLDERIFFVERWEILGYIFAFLWFLLVINSLNWIDGIDGLAPGIIVISGASIAAVSLRPEVFQPPIFLLACILCGSFLGLWLFNIHPAHFFSGTAGIFVAGFILAYLSLFSGVKIATLFLVLALPILDALRVLFWRITTSQSLTKPDRNHIHYTLLEWGWNKKYVSFFLLSIATFFSFSTFFFQTRGKIMTICMISFIFFGCLIAEYMYRKKDKTPVS
ncbi:MAG: hypothetical protein IPN70_03515 [Candidatus Moraniibacteriota bacterium]|nr:MAG: hypothetical protein IPN70_03515 [Candidatus Moranbacteria bacterium]